MEGLGRRGKGNGEREGWGGGEGGDRGERKGMLEEQQVNLPKDEGNEEGEMWRRVTRV